MVTIKSGLTLPIIVRRRNLMDFPVLDFTCMWRIQDTVVILNRIIRRWDAFHKTLDSSRLWLDEEIREAVRIEVIESTFSFITFFFLLIGFHKGIIQEIKKLLAELSGDAALLDPFPAEDGVIRDLGTLRHKMAAHSAHVEPRKDDSMDARLAYFQWYVGFWGDASDTRNRRLNTFGFGQSEHAIPPEFEDMIREAQEYISVCEQCVRQNAQVLTHCIETKKTGEYVVAGDYPRD